MPVVSAHYGTADPAVSERLFVRLEEDALSGPESSAPADTLHALPVPRPLVRHVAHLLAYREVVPPEEEIVERVLPDGVVRLVLNLGDVPGGSRSAGRRPALAIVGATTEPALVHLRGHVDGLSVTLRAGAAPALFGVAAGELNGSILALEDVWGTQARELAEQLAAAPDAAARAATLADALTRRLERRDAAARSRSRAAPAASPAAAQLVERVLRRVGSRGGVDSLRSLAAATGIGKRRLQQLFHVHAGLSPRAASRVARLHACLRLLRARASPSWAALAVEAGYYDQSHLANEFRALCGLTPGQLRARTTSRSSKS